MPKLLPILLIVALPLLLTGCGNNVNSPGLAWAQTETLEYAITQGDAPYGTMQVVTQRVSGEVSLAAHPERTHTLGTDGSRITTTVWDGAGNVVMQSEMLMNLSNAVASSRTITNEQGTQSYHAYLEGKYIYASINGGDYQRTRARGTYTTNEAMYAMLRCYDLTSYSTSFRILSPVDGNKIELNASTSAVDDVFSFTTVNADGEKQASAVKSYRAVIRLSESPVGQNMFVWYTRDFTMTGNIAASHLPYTSTQIPVKIVENDMTYSLQRITAA